jgi:TPR repeat protein
MNVQTVIGALLALGMSFMPTDLSAATSATVDGEQEVVVVDMTPQEIFEFGTKLEEGSGVPRDYAQAAFCYARAAESGHAEAMNRLGILYATGRGVPQDFVAAFALYRLAAEGGSASSARNVAIAYFHGLGVQQSYPDAAKWLEPAAARGDADAQYKLGTLFNEGLGVTKDPHKAVELFQLAAGQGYAPAMVNLGSLHAHGNGVPRDDVRAYALIVTAIEMGIPEDIRGVALYELGALSERLGEKRVAKAEKLADEIYTAATQIEPARNRTSAE